MHVNEACCGRIVASPRMSTAYLLFCSVHGCYIDVRDSLTGTYVGSGGAGEHPPLGQDKIPSPLDFKDFKFQRPVIVILFVNLGKA